MKTIAVVIGIASLSFGSLFGYFYNFAGPDVTIGNTATFTSNGINITAYGYNYNPSLPSNLGTLTNMFQKNDGGDEVGLGIASEVDHEINHTQFIQLNLSNLIAAGVNTISLGLGSVQAGENWGIYQSNTQGMIGSVISGFGSGTADFPTLFSLSISAANPYIAITETNSGGDITLAVLSTPEPATYLGLASFLGLAGLIGRRRLVSRKVSMS